MGFRIVCFLEINNKNVIVSIDRLKPAFLLDDNIEHHYTEKRDVIIPMDVETSKAKTTQKCITPRARAEKFVSLTTFRRVCDKLICKNYLRHIKKEKKKRKALSLVKGYCSGTRQQTSQRFLSRGSLHKDSTLRTR